MAQRTEWPRTQREMVEAIKEIAASISQDEIDRACDSFRGRTLQCIDAEGSWFEFTRT